jgi:hypothetical protein
MGCLTVENRKNMINGCKEKDLSWKKIGEDLRCECLIDTNYANEKRKIPTNIPYIGVWWKYFFDVSEKEEEI